MFSVGLMKFLFSLCRKLNSCGGNHLNRGGGGEISCG